MKNTKVFFSITLTSITAITAIALIPLPAKALPKILEKQIEKFFRAADTNKDGALSAAEAKAGGMPASLLKSFDRFDIDKNGKIDIQELFKSFNSQPTKTTQTPTPLK